VVYIESGIFTRRVHWILERRLWMCLASFRPILIDNPVRGDLVQGLGGIRKARCSNPVRGKGKRGGYRFLYLYLESRHHIHLLYLLDKGEQEDLTNEERKALRALVSQVRASRERTSL